jgi:hypothetical protein
LQYVGKHNAFAHVCEHARHRTPQRYEIFDELSSSFSSLIEHDFRANVFRVCRDGKPLHPPHPVSAKATPGPLARSAAQALAKAARPGQAFSGSCSGCGAG